ncbi:MAG: Gfo/Idh/MocA family oxidoreductase [Gemmataceae bacterium]
MPPTPEHHPVDRRRFLRTAAAGAALPLTASSYAAVPGSNSRLRVGFLGCGGRAQAHLHLALKLPDVAVAAVCDVWDGLADEYEQTVGGRTTRRTYCQGLYPTAERAGLPTTDRQRVTKDYRAVLDSKDVDAVVIATPDHWHARMTLDALAAGKDVLVETPMTRTPAEAAAVLAAAERSDRVLAVAHQSLADPAVAAARELIRGGKLGTVAHLSAGVFRNDARGFGRYYRLPPNLAPATLDWGRFLGHRVEVNGEPIGPDPRAKPFDPATFAQWRCDAAFSGGPLTDLYAHPVARLLAASGLRTPTRVTAAGGLCVERDGRSVPDVATVLAEFVGGCQLLVTGATACGGAMPEVVRGRLGSATLEKGGVRFAPDPPVGERAAASPEWLAVTPPANDTDALWRNFLDGVRRRDRAGVFCPPGLGAATVAVVGQASG